MGCGSIGPPFALKIGWNLSTIFSSKKAVMLANAMPEGLLALNPLELTIEGVVMGGTV